MQLTQCTDTGAVAAALWAWVVGVWLEGALPPQPAPRIAAPTKRTQARRRNMHRGYHRRCRWARTAGARRRRFKPREPERVTVPQGAAFVRLHSCPERLAELNRAITRIEPAARSVRTQQSLPPISRQLPGRQRRSRRAPSTASSQLQHRSEPCPQGRSWRRHVRGCADAGTGARSGFGTSSARAA